MKNQINIKLDPILLEKFNKKLEEQGQKKNPVLVLLIEKFINGVPSIDDVKKVMSKEIESEQISKFQVSITWLAIKLLMSVK